ncbi:hypothetical protein [Paenibacillus illinoisensis]|uniref:hypothetical protein n=1 Tax=Paenibacillus illinoisensis TaxID=59845 RepID=UPI00203C6361|nr:hypothetical protein [Paenibacillus illinoisensis]MCM3205575.1 hypothetical protein [Paenibacillus illinoisensis]
MYLKRIIVSGLTVCLLAAGSPVFADENNNVVVSSNVEGNIQTIDLQNGFENLPEEVVVSEVLTFDELVTVLAKEKGITEDEASNIIMNNSITSSRSAESKITAAQSATYRTIKQYLYGIPGYSPSLEFYCQTSEGGSARGIVKILNTDLNTLSWDANIQGYITKTYVGTVYVNLENANKIHYIVNGKFYHTGGVKTVTGNVGLSIGGTLTLGISATADEKNLFYTVYWPGDVKF